MATLKNAVYKIITLPVINSLLRRLWHLLKSLIPINWLIKFPIVGCHELTIQEAKFTMCSDGRDSIATTLFWDESAFEAQTLAIYQKLLPFIDTILDVGANTGLYGLLALSVDSTKHVYAFEPVPNVFAHLKNNFAVNNFINGYALPNAVSNSTGQITLHVPQHLNLASGASAVRQFNRSEDIVVDVISLDQFVEEAQIAQVDFIKIDVELLEAQVIEGAANLIQRDHPIIICEILDDEIGTQITQLLAEQSYHFYHIGIQNLERQAKITTRIEVTATSIERNYLLIPAEKTDWLGL